MAEYRAENGRPGYERGRIIMLNDDEAKEYALDAAFRRDVSAAVRLSQVSRRALPYLFGVAIGTRGQNQVLNSRRIEWDDPPPP